MTTTAATAPGVRSEQDALSLRLLRQWRDGWGDVTLLATDLLTGVAAMILTVCLVASVASIPGALVGIPFLVLFLWLAGVAGTAERHRVSALSGRTVKPPRLEVGRPWWHRFFLDQQRWRSAAYLAVHSLWGTVVGALTLTLLAQSLLLVLLPVLRLVTEVDEVRVLWYLPIGTGIGPALGMALGAAFLLGLPLLARAVASVDVMLARWLLGGDDRDEVEALAARVDTLTESRQLTVDSVEAERRRIERDLHDGPQQRLVSIAMTLGMARDALDRDPAASRALLDEAHTSAKEAIVEMRQVARGIVPPVLADRGLDAALSALATRTPLPVSVTVREVGRVDPTIEAIAYFVVSEALTNVAKHASATSACVEVVRAARAEAQWLTVRVTDDGRGGADPARGTGLTGLRQRVAAVDGRLTVSSPPGGPTTLEAVLPLRTDRSPR